MSREPSDMGSNLMRNGVEDDPVIGEPMDVDARPSDKSVNGDKMKIVHNSPGPISEEPRDDTPSTYDSNFPTDGGKRHSPARQKSMETSEESIRLSLARRVTFAETAASQTITSPPPPASRRLSLPNFDQREPLRNDDKSPFHPASHIISLPPPILGSFTKRPRESTSTIIEGTPKRPRPSENLPNTHVAPEPTPGQIFKTSISRPATVILTSTYGEWSNYFVCLGGDGDLSLLDNRTHEAVKPALVRIWARDYTASSAINGAWIGPGKLALVHKEASRNRGDTQVTVVEYSDLEMSRKPRFMHLHQVPRVRKITSIASLSAIGRKSRFVTGGRGPEVHDC
jgi:hypothetical protein